MWILNLSVCCFLGTQILSFIAQHFWQEVFVQQRDKLDWGTEFIVALFFILMMLLTWALQMHWRWEDVTGGWFCSTRAGEGEDGTFP